MTLPRKPRHHRKEALLAAAALGVLGAAACVGSVGGGDPSGPGSGGGGADGGAPLPIGPAAGTDHPVAVPFAHLTSAQYVATLIDLFAPIAVTPKAPPSDVVVEGFDNNASVQVPSAPLLDAYHDAAVKVTVAAMGSAAKLLGCTPASRADEDACAGKFFGPFAKRAYRRPVTADEVADLTAFYASRRAAGDDFPTAMTLSIETILQSPYFLYRVELGTPIAGRANVVQLGGYEMASRLSYLLWNTMPDDALFASAESGELNDPGGLEKQARRMLTDPRAHAALARFHHGWLKFDVMRNLSKDTTVFPAFTPAVATAMQQSAEKFVDGVLFGGGTLTTLLTDSHAWVNDDLAPIYGVPKPGSANLTLVPVDPTQRAGILTNAGLMAGFAHGTADSPVLRGVFVLERLLCAPSPAPPPGVNATPPTAPAGSGPKTTRDIFATTHEQGGCAGCHHTIDGIGFGFEHYDAIGAYRTTDNGLPVDATGWFPGGALDVNGPFKDAIDLGSRLAASASVQGCVASYWLRYALGVDHTGVDLTQLGSVVQGFRANNLGLQELLVAITKSDGFRTRLTGN
jgi:Protein of unknown function (DUF1592)/Protein of unknown function (DUF1588)/Protein of unknown function (DUF1595)/Protein of unknown function (DUF1585)/Protein of unknown function (DUF1587)